MGERLLRPAIVVASAPPAPPPETSRSDEERSAGGRAVGGRRGHRRNWEVSFGLGSTRWQTVITVVLRSALPGITTGIVLSLGRSISETAAVMLTAGSALRLPRSLFDSSRTLALHFYILSREGISMPNAYATASVLIIAILALNLLACSLMRRFVAKLGR